MNICLVDKISFRFLFYLYLIVVTTKAFGVSIDLKLPYPSGEQWYITNGYGDGYHKDNDYYSLDFNLPRETDRGRSIVAVAEGIVESARWSNSYGYFVIVNHGGGYTSRYAHLDRINVIENVKIAQGQEIGKCGDTGWADGVHLHFTLYFNGASVKPEPMSKYTDFISNSYPSGYKSDNISVYSSYKFSANTVYLMSNNQLWPIPNPETYCKLGFATVHCGNVSDWSYLIILPNEAKTNYKIRNELLPSKGLETKSQGMVVKVVDTIGPRTCSQRDSSINQSTIFLFDRSDTNTYKFRPILSASIYSKLGYKMWDDVVDITQDLFNMYGLGSNVDGIGTELVGRFQDGWHSEYQDQNNGRSEAFLTTYLDLGGKSKLGLPFNNGDGEFVHKWPNDNTLNNVIIQDFRGSIYGADGQIALIYNRGQNKSWLLKEGFWGLYKPDQFTLSFNDETLDDFFGPRDLGAPRESEHNDVSDSSIRTQEFQKGWFQWHSRTDTFKIIWKSGYAPIGFQSNVAYQVIPNWKTAENGSIVSRTRVSNLIVQAGSTTNSQSFQQYATKPLGRTHTTALRGQEQVNVSWNIQDTPVNATTVLAYTLNDGQSYTDITFFSAAQTSYSWTPPFVSGTNYRVKCTVKNIRGYLVETQLSPLYTYESYSPPPTPTSAPVATSTHTPTISLTPILSPTPSPPSGPWAVVDQDGHPYPGYVLTVAWGNLEPYDDRVNIEIYIGNERYKVEATNVPASGLIYVNTERWPSNTLYRAKVIPMNGSDPGVYSQYFSILKYTVTTSLAASSVNVGDNVTLNWQIAENSFIGIFIHVYRYGLLQQMLPDYYTPPGPAVINTTGWEGGIYQFYVLAGSANAEDGAFSDECTVVTPQALLYVDTDYLYFDTLVGKREDQSFLIRNDGAATLTGLVYVGYPITHIMDPAISLESGEAMEFWVSCQPTSEVIREEQIQISTNGGVHNIAVDLYCLEPAPIPEPTATFSQTSTNTATAMSTPTFTYIPMNTQTPNFTPTPTNSYIPTSTHTPTNTPTATKTPTHTATVMQTPTAPQTQRPGENVLLIDNGWLVIKNALNYFEAGTAPPTMMRKPVLVYNGWQSILTGEVVGSDFRFPASQLDPGTHYVLPGLRDGSESVLYINPDWLIKQKLPASDQALWDGNWLVLNVTIGKNVSLGAGGVVPTSTPTTVFTPTFTHTPIDVLSYTPTFTYTQTNTITPISTPTGIIPTPTFTSTATLTHTPTNTPTVTPASISSYPGELLLKGEKIIFTTEVIVYKDFTSNLRDISKDEVLQQIQSGAKMVILGDYNQWEYKIGQSVVGEIKENDVVFKYNESLPSESKRFVPALVGLDNKQYFLVHIEYIKNSVDEKFWYLDPNNGWFGQLPVISVSPSPTATTINTPQPIPTNTHTPTQISTPTFAHTPTFTPTSTLTFTPTNIPPVTQTPTLTNNVLSIQGSELIVTNPQPYFRQNENVLMPSENNNRHPVLVNTSNWSVMSVGSFDGNAFHLPLENLPQKTYLVLVAIQEGSEAVGSFDWLIFEQLPQPNETTDRSYWVPVINNNKEEMRLVLKISSSGHSLGN